MLRYLSPQLQCLGTLVNGQATLDPQERNMSQVTLILHI